MLNRVGLAVTAALFGPVILLGLFGLVLQGFEFFSEHDPFPQFPGVAPVFRFVLFLVTMFLCGRWGWKSGGR